MKSAKPKKFQKIIMDSRDMDSIKLIILALDNLDMSYASKLLFAVLNKYFVL